SKFCASVIVASAAVLSGVSLRDLDSPSTVAEANAKIDNVQKSRLSTTEKITPYKDVTNYNNYYEFSTDKYGPAGLAKDFPTRPWTVKVEGLANKPRTFDVDEIIKQNPLEERIYRHRCVEGWSMVLPWVGFPLANL